MKRTFLMLACAGAMSLGSAPAIAQITNTPPALTVLQTAPTGEIASSAEAKEIRIIFSEPMVTLGRIPAQIQPSFIKTTPSIAGTFRWSGTTILILTPDPRRPLPDATTFTVTVAGAVAASGRKQTTPVRFTFTTPTVHLLATDWYRRGDRFDGRPVVVLRFNQRVNPSDVLRHVSARLVAHPWMLPDLEGLRTRLRRYPEALASLDAKVERTRSAAAATAPVQLALTTDWDRKRFPAKPDLVVLEATTPVPPESLVTVTLDAALPSPAGSATPGKTQEYRVEVEHAFFPERFDCAVSCDPDLSNALILRGTVKNADFAKAVRVTDVTVPARPADMPRPHAPRDKDVYGDTYDESAAPTLEDAGFDAQPPAHTYSVTVDPSLRATDGQTLGFMWLGTIENWHRRAFTSFGDGHGVWEVGGGAQLPFYARNYRNATAWAAAVPPRELMPTLRRLQDKNFIDHPAGAGIARVFSVVPDVIQSHGLDVSGALNGKPTGLVWAAVQPGTAIPQAKRDDERNARASLIQVTNLGITVKDSPENTLVFVTRLDTGAPVAGASVSIVRLDNSVFWRGVTGDDGLAVAPDTALRDSNEWWKFAFIVMAEKDGDVAYVGSDWNEGVQPWDFGSRFDLGESPALLRGSVFTDRGVYRLGEEVHFKTVLRQNTASSVRLLPAGTSILVSVHDSQQRLVDERTLKLNAWSSAEGTFRLPDGGTVGGYALRVILESDRPKPKDPASLRPGQEPGPAADDEVPDARRVEGSFLVADYRRPDFRVDVLLAGGSAPNEGLTAGTSLNATITARYLFGARMQSRPVTWTLTRSPLLAPPAPVLEKYPAEQWEFVGGWDEDPKSGYVGSRETTLTKQGTLPLTLATAVSDGLPWQYSLEADVEDLSRQHIANRAAIVVHPANWYVGVRRLPYFTQQKTGIKTEIVAVGLDGAPVPGVPIELKLTQIQWNSVRRAEGNGFYTWDSQKREVAIGTWTVTTGEKPVAFETTLPSGGNFVLTATGRGEAGHFAVTRSSFFALGDGYTAWARFDHNRIELVPERKTWKPGETARIMIESPWETATAVMTTEREGVRTYKQFALTSTQQSIAVPITEADIPNVFVSVLLVKGRTNAALVPAGAASGGDATDTADSGKPAFRLGYVELKVEDAAKRLSIAVKANKEEYRPANTATLDVDVTDSQHRGSAGEVTLWAVDYGVLSLTAYRTPDILRSVYVEKALQVMNVDSRQRIVSRRVLTPKGTTDGGGGGASESVMVQMRTDFRVLAFWLGSVTTDAAGHACAEVKLPESLTTYRIMAVAGDRASRFGAGESEVRINKPVTLKPAYPRFLAVGDTALFGSVIVSQLPGGGDAVVTMKSLDPDVLQLTAAGQQTVAIGGGGSVEVRFQAAGRSVGRARVRMTVQVGSESDSFEDTIPVEVLAGRETVAAYGEATDASAIAHEAITVPAGVVPGTGGLHVELASTAMVGLGEGARYLVEYPYGCAEQKGSRALAMMLASDLGDAFTLPGVDTSKLRPTVQQTLAELATFQCPTGGFAYWPGQCWSTSPYLTAYVLHVFQVAAGLKYQIDTGVRNRAYTYLETELGKAPPQNEGWWPAYTAWQAFAVKVLAEGGRNQDSNITRLYGYRDRMPVFALAYLHDALLAKGESAGARVLDLRRRMSNAVLPEAGSAHVEELSDPYLLWFWNSNIRSTAIVLNSLSRIDGAEAPRPMVRWLLDARKDGRWGNTQENALAMESLVRYYRKYESTVPDFRAVVRLGDEEIAREQFAGRAATARSTDLPMARLLTGSAPGASKPLTFSREGTGTLFYTTRLQYTADALVQQGLDNGFRLERSYAPYVEQGSKPAATTFKAGDLVRVTLTFALTKERRFVAVTDPLPAGFEAVESWFASTKRSLANDQDRQPEAEGNWMSWWERGGFDHIERRDDRIQLFATRLSAGTHSFTYIVRATTAGTFRTAPAHAEEMYAPEVWGRTGTTIIEVRR
jgi:uncharacterized protein YfaS (alpha-2-macroglobulin family)